MTPQQLREEIAIELELIEAIVAEVASLSSDLKARTPTLREQTAAAAFLAQFYSGVENILKRIHRFYDVPSPSGDSWHIEIFRRFCAPGFPPLPVLFDSNLSTALAPFRKFRHVVYHSYGFQLDWERMREGIATVGDIYDRLKQVLANHLNQLE